MVQGKRKAQSNLTSFVTSMVGIALSAFAIGCVYALAAWYSPIALLNVAITIGVACTIGWLVAKISIACLVPSRTFLWVAGFLAGLIALYASWGTNAAIRIPGVLTAGFSPDFLIAFAHELYANSDVRIEGETGGVTVFEGPWLLALWIVEAAVLVVGSALVTKVCFDGLAPPFCQRCRIWQNKEHGILRCGMPEDFDTFAGRIVAKDFSCLDELPDGSFNDDPHIRIDVGWCSLCNDSCDATVSVVSYSSEPSELCICHRLNISHATLRRIQSLAVTQDASSDTELIDAANPCNDG